MKHFPIFLNLTDQRVVVSGTGETALAKLRLLLKTKAQVSVYGETPHPQVISLAASNKLSLIERPVTYEDIADAWLVYAANGNATMDAKVAKFAARAGVLVNVVDNLGDSDFITPAIVDRDPVTVAIGTEGTAPVLARQIKAQIEETLPRSLGVLARIAEVTRSAAEILPMGRARREFWSDFFFTRGPRAFSAKGKTGAQRALLKLLSERAHSRKKSARFELVGAGTGDPELLTLRARKALHEADVVVYGTAISKDILELARREAEMVPHTPLGGVPNSHMVAALDEGKHVIWLQAGNPRDFEGIASTALTLVGRNVEASIIPGVPISHPETPIFETNRFQTPRKSTANRQMTESEYA